MRSLTRVLVIAFVFAGVAPVPAIAQRGKLDDHLRRMAAAGSDGRVHVIVTARRDGLARAAETARRRGGAVKAAHAALNALSVEMRRSELDALAADPAVERISIDATVTVLGRPRARDANERRGRRDAEARRSSRGKPNRPALLRSTLGAAGLPYTGAGIGVAIIDSGIEPLSDFGSRITAFRDFTVDDAPLGRAVAPYDDFGHGTHVAGLIGSTGGLSQGEFAGMAPAVRLIGLKVLDSTGRGTTSDVIAAIEFAIRYRAALGIDVINLSLGHPIYEPIATDPLVQAVEKATRAGLIVVAAAGNVGRNGTGEAGYAGIMSPGNAPSAITVGAVSTNGTVDRLDDRVAEFSSRGPTWYDALLKPDLVAPGDDIVSNISRGSWLARTYPRQVTGEGRASFMRLSGTSMSAALTTGVVALVLEAQRAGAIARAGRFERWPFLASWTASSPYAPRLSANAVKALLQYSALPVTGGGDPLAEGAGALNAEGAARLAFTLDAAAPMATRWLDDFGQPATIVAGRAIPWSQTVYWGGQAVRGPSIAVKELAWLGHVVWGTNVVWGYDEHIVWGTNWWDEHIVWGSSWWDEHIVWGTDVNGFSYADEHIVWGTGTPFAFSYLSDEHIVWGASVLWDDHIVWGTSMIGLFRDEHIVWGSAGTRSNTVWGNLYDLHIVWGTHAGASR